MTPPRHMSSLVSRNEGLNAVNGSGGAVIVVRSWGLHFNTRPLFSSTCAVFVKETTQRTPHKVLRMSREVDECKPLLS